MLRTARRGLRWGGRGDTGFEAMGVAYQVRCGTPGSLPYHVWRIRHLRKAGRSARPGDDAFRSWWTPSLNSTPGLVRPDDPLQLARYIWAVVHGVALLAIDGLLPAAMDADALIRFANERLRDRNSMTAYLRLSPHPSAATAMPACMAASVSNLRALVRPTL